MPEKRLIVGDLDPATIYEEHQQQFECISKWLEEYYKGYANSEKIIILLGYWLYAYRCILICYGVEGAKDFCQSGFGSHIRFAYAYDFDVDIDIKLRKIISRFLFRLTAGSIKTAYLPGGRVTTVATKIASRVTKIAAMSTPLVVRNNRKQTLVRKLADWFRDYDKQEIGECLDYALPAVFFADQAALFTGKVLHVDCSASSFMDFCGYENILLFGRRLHVTGRQHGGGYDMFSDDYWILSEKKLCDKFIGWGMSCSNEHQHKYPSNDRPSMSDGREKKIIWVEHACLPEMTSLMFQSYYAQSNNKRVVEYVYNELISIERQYFSLVYPGPLKSPDYAGMRGEELANKNGKGESAICVNDVVIFDISGASLIHYCIEHEITFVLVVCRDDIVNFTEMANEWLNILRSTGLAFFDDEAGLLSERLIEILSDEFELPARVKNYHRERFTDI